MTRATKSQNFSASFKVYETSTQFHTDTMSHSKVIKF